MRQIAQKAKDFASFKHRLQIRKHGRGEPYMSHVEAVVAILKRHGHTSEDLLAAAYLHDTVEQTDTSITEIYNLFGTEVAKFVYWLTDEKRGNKAMQRQISAWRVSRAPLEAKYIKLADIIDNTRNIVANNPDAAPEYLVEKKQAMWAMADEEEAIMRTPIFVEALQNVEADMRTVEHRAAG